MAIGGRTGGEWDQYYLDAYRTGGVEAERAARQEYRDAYSAQHGGGSQQSVNTPIFGNVSWDSIPGYVNQTSSASPGGGDPFSMGNSASASPTGLKPSVQNPGAPGNGQSMPSGINPYLPMMGQVMAGQMTDAFRTQVLPGVGSQAMAAGGYGGSRQGVIEANAMNDLGRNIGNSLTNLYGQGYNTALNYDLGLRNNQLGFGNLGLGYAGLDRQINNDNWANQMQGVNLGLGIWDRLMNNNQTGINAGTNIQNRPMDYWNQWSQGANSIGQGYGTQTSSGSNQGNPMLGALGGAQLGGQFSNWWSGGGNTSSMPNSNVFFGNGSMGD